jgi:hypothetical protein
MAQLLSNLPVGAKVKFGKHKVSAEAAMPIIWTIVAKNHPGYPANAITLHAEKIIDLRCFDAKEPSNPNSDREEFGNNRYSVSNIDQWLNKDSPPGAWYAAQHTYDQAPDAANVENNTQYVTRPGFLYHFSTEERNAILPTTLRVVKPIGEGGGIGDTITRKVFLPSVTEIGLPFKEGGWAEGTTWGFYTSSAARIAYLTAQAFNNTLSNQKPSAIGKAWYWWLRTPYSSNSFEVYSIRSDGTPTNYNPASDGSRGVRPALNLPSSLLVSDTTDADGCYTFTWWTPPDMTFDINNVKKSYDNGWCKINGALKQIDKVWTKVNGVLREV